VKSGGESGGPLGGSGGPLGEVFIEHHDLCFFMVDAHTASLCPGRRLSWIEIAMGIWLLEPGH